MWCPLQTYVGKWIPGLPDKPTSELADSVMKKSSLGTWYTKHMMPVDDEILEQVGKSEAGTKK